GGKASPNEAFPPLTAPAGHARRESLDLRGALPPPRPPRKTPGRSPSMSHPRRIPPLNRPGGPRSIWAPRRVREVGAQFPDRQGRVSPSQAFLNLIYPANVRATHCTLARSRLNVAFPKPAL